MDRARARTTWSRWKEAWKEGKGQGTTPTRVELAGECTESVSARRKAGADAGDGGGVKRQQLMLIRIRFRGEEENYNYHEYNFEYVYVSDPGYIIFL